MLVSLALTGVTQALLSAFTSFPLLGNLPFLGRAIGFIGGLVVTLLLSTLVFALLFKYLPDTRVRWNDVWLGGLFTAIIWELAKRLLAFYIDYSSRSFSAYGAIGTILVLMLWVYFSSQILFMGAEFTEVYSRRHGSRAAQPGPKPEVQPAPAADVEPAVAQSPAHSTGTVVAATGAGVLVGALGALLAALVALIIGARRAAASVARRVSRN
jgi:membrane protein